MSPISPEIFRFPNSPIEVREEARQQQEDIPTTQKPTLTYAEQRAQLEAERNKPVSVWQIFDDGTERMVYAAKPLWEAEKYIKMQKQYNPDMGDCGLGQWELREPQLTPKAQLRQSTKSLLSESKTEANLPQNDAVENEGLSTSELAKRLNIPRTTLNDLRRHPEKIAISKYREALKDWEVGGDRWIRKV